MTSLLISLIASALMPLGNHVDIDAGATALHYSVQFDQGTGSASLRCEGSSTGNCTFWIGDALEGRTGADASGTLHVGETPVIVRVRSGNPGYCAGNDLAAPPKWPDCTRGPLGGALDRSATVEYRRD